MIVIALLNARELTLLAVKFSNVAHSLVLPQTGRIGHEAYAIDAIAVVETVRLQQPILECETCAQRDFDKRIARRWPLENQFKDTPAFDFVLV